MSEKCTRKCNSDKLLLFIYLYSIKQMELLETELEGQYL
jgi:hypothetical protein